MLQNKNIKTLKELVYDTSVWRSPFQEKFPCVYNLYFKELKNPLLFFGRLRDSILLNMKRYL